MNPPGISGGTVSFIFIILKSPKIYFLNNMESSSEIS